jgi:5-methylcytosine-specific restriction endonuclease McrA
MRICSGAGCGRKVPDDVRFCAECRSATADGDGIRSHSNADRDRLGHLYGGPRWKKRIQPSVLSRDPFCKKCSRAVSEIADHIIPAGVAIEQANASKRWPLDPWAGFYLMCNLQGLCRSCHKIKTDEDKAHQGEWPNVIAAYDAAPKKVWKF